MVRHVYYKLPTDSAIDSLELAYIHYVQPNWTRRSINIDVGITQHIAYTQIHNSVGAGKLSE